MPADNTARKEPPSPELSVEPVKRTRGRPFPPGRSGNPKGRPAGARNRITSLALQLLDGAAEDVVAKAVEMAKDGQPLALRLVLDRVAPLRRDRRVELGDMRRIQTAVDVVEVSSRVLELASAGELSIDEAAAFLRLLEFHRKSIEGADLAVKIQLLESELESERRLRENRRD